VASDRQEYVLRLMRGEGHTPSDRLAAAGLRALSGLYGVALHAHLAGYRLGLARRTRLPALVVSVGNLTVGGTGKTTTCLALAGWFLQEGKKVALLSRGYRGRGGTATCVVSEGQGPQVGAEVAGDEPYLAAKARPGMVVVVGKDRRRTGRLAVTRYGAEVVLLDDGFQYQRLVRDLDIVLVDALAPFGYDGLVPRGLLREPVAHLARAEAVWLTHCDLVRREDLAATRARVEKAAPQARIWETRHAAIGLRKLGSDEWAEPEALLGKRVAALSGVGNPVAFERSLEKLGAEVMGRARFPDHHRYEAEEVRAALRREALGAEWVVTTAKDAVRLPEEALEKPTWVLEITLAGLPGAATLAEELTWLLTAKSRR